MGTDVKSISETKTPAPPSKKKKKKKRVKERGRRTEPGTKLMAHNAASIVTK